MGKNHPKTKLALKSVQLPKPLKLHASTSLIVKIDVSTSQTTKTSSITTPASSPKSTTDSKLRQCSGSNRLTRQFRGVLQSVLCSQRIGTTDRATLIVQPIGSQRLPYSAPLTSGFPMACMWLQPRWAASRARLPKPDSNITKEPTRLMSIN